MTWHAFHKLFTSWRRPTASTFFHFCCPCHARPFHGHVTDREPQQTRYTILLPLPQATDDHDSFERHFNRQEEWWHSFCNILSHFFDSPAVFWAKETDWPKADKRFWSLWLHIPLLHSLISWITCFCSILEFNTLVWHLSDAFTTESLLAKGITVVNWPFIDT